MKIRQQRKHQTLEHIPKKHPSTEARETSSLGFHAWDLVQTAKMKMALLFSKASLRKVFADWSKMNITLSCRKIQRVRAAGNYNHLG